MGNDIFKIYSKYRYLYMYVSSYVILKVLLSEMKCILSQLLSFTQHMSQIGPHYSLRGLCVIFKNFSDLIF